MGDDGEPEVVGGELAIKPEQAPARDERGRLLPGHTANRSGRPRLLREYQEWLEREAYPKAKEALLRALASNDGRVAIAAVKEVREGLFGKAPLVFTDEEGNEIKGRIAGVIILPDDRSEDE